MTTGSDVPGTIILQGVVGSHAQGLATPDSDVDHKGVFVLPTRDVLSLGKTPKAHSVDKDTTYYEIERFLELGAKSNPQVLELLFLDEYEVLTPEGRALVQRRHEFLSQAIRRSFGGSAVAHMWKAQDDNHELRSAKAARHGIRLLRQGIEALKTGDLKVRVTDREAALCVENLSPERLWGMFQTLIDELDAIPSDLPKLPDRDLMNALLFTTRLRHV